MINNNTFLLKFGISPNSFKPIEATPIKTDTGYSYPLFQRTDIGRQCPHCCYKYSSIKDYNFITVNCSSNGNVTESLYIKKVRFKCNRCKKTFTPEIEGIDKYKHISDFVLSNMVNDFYKKYTFYQIAQNYNVSPGYVIKLFDDTFKYVPRKELSEIICIDEFHFKKVYDQNYCVAITDFVNSNLIDIVRNRKKDYLEEYFNKFSSKELNRVKVYISDMYDEYRSIKKKYMPNAIHVVDMFHIINQMTTLVNHLRNKAMRTKIEPYSMEYNFMSKNWKQFLCRSHRIANKTYTYMKTGECYSYFDLVFLCVKKDNNLLLAYNVLQDLYKYSKNQTIESIDKFIDFISQRLINSGCEEIIKVGLTFRKWKAEIKNAFSPEAREKRYTNGVAEGMNSKIRNILKPANGYGNFERFRKRIMLIYAYKKESA